MANRIRELREARGLAQNTLAGMMGLSRAEMSKLENGDRRLRQSHLDVLVPLLGVSAEEIAGMGTAPGAGDMAAILAALGRIEARLARVEAMVARGSKAA